MTPLQAHMRLLESLPKERITTHHRKESLRRRSYGQPIPDGLEEQYRQLKLSGATFKHIRATLNVSSDMMGRLREAVHGDAVKLKGLSPAEQLKRQRQDPEFLAKQRAAASAYMKAKHADPEWKAKNLERLREGQERKRREREGR